MWWASPRVLHPVTTRIIPRMPRCVRLEFNVPTRRQTFTTRTPAGFMTNCRTLGPNLDAAPWVSEDLSVHYSDFPLTRPLVFQAISFPFLVHPSRPTRNGVEHYLPETSCQSEVQANEPGTGSGNRSPARLTQTARGPERTRKLVPMTHFVDRLDISHLGLGPVPATTIRRSRPGRRQTGTSRFRELVETADGWPGPGGKIGGRVGRPGRLRGPGRATSELEAVFSCRSAPGRIRTAGRVQRSVASRVQQCFGGSHVAESLSGTQSTHSFDRPGSAGQPRPPGPCGAPPVRRIVHGLS
jgi:hypothetical protein